MHDIKGYCMLKSLEGTLIGYSNTDRKTYDDIKKCALEQPLPIMDIGVGGSGFLVFDPKGRCLIDIQSMDSVKSYFLCKEFSGVVMPHDYNDVQTLNYAVKCLSRKGGYSNLIRQMVILTSLHSGRFDDRFLWSCSDGMKEH